MVNTSGPHVVSTWVWNFPMAPCLGFKGWQGHRLPLPTLILLFFPQHYVTCTQHQEVMDSLHGNVLWLPGDLHLVTPKSGMQPRQVTSHSLTMTKSHFFFKLTPQPVHIFFLSLTTISPNTTKTYVPELSRITKPIKVILFCVKHSA